jgi:hypothetical protein
MLDGTRQQVLCYHTFMARRKPKSQPTGIIDVVKDIVSPWLGAPAGQNSKVTQAQGLARGAAETLDQTFAGGLVKAGVQGNKALAKQAAINAAALGTGYIAGKAVQKALPLVQSRIGNELGVHLSDTDKLRNIKFAPERAGKGLKYSGVEPNQTYKFSPNLGYSVDDVTKKIITPKYVYPPLSSSDFAENVAQYNVEISANREMPSKTYAYITQSRRGEIDPKFPIWANAQMVPKQRVTSKVTLPRVGVEQNKILTEVETNANFDQVRKVLYDALLKREQITQSNLRSTLNTVRGAAGVAAQQTGTKKIKRR